MDAVISLAAGAFMIFGPVFGYVPQYRSISATKDASGFSLFVSLILFVANILRIFFWVGKRFETTLLFQSIVMIVAQFLLLELCVRVRRRGGVYQRSSKSILSSGLKNFWNWDDFLDYIIFLGGFTLALLLLAFVFIDDSWFVELIGFLALGIESCLGVPQLYQNYKKGSTAGLSYELIGSWAIGDLFKTMYFLMSGAPLQFILCGAIQLTVDAAITYQIMTYDNKPTL